jgi:hypothetical protein
LLDFRRQALRRSLAISSTICVSADSTYGGWRRSISSGGWWALPIICENWRADPASFFVFCSFHPKGVFVGLPQITFRTAPFFPATPDDDTALLYIPFNPKLGINGKW